VTCVGLYCSFIGDTETCVRVHVCKSVGFYVYTLTVYWLYCIYERLTSINCGWLASPYVYRICIVHTAKLAELDSNVLYTVA